LFFEIIKKIDRPLGNLTKMRREKTKSVKSEIQRGDNNKHHGNPGNHSETTLRAYTLINLKILKKWRDFWKLTTTQN
jgi:hypothetical protein